MRTARLLIAAAYCLPAVLLLWIETAPSHHEDNFGAGMQLFGLSFVVIGFSGSALLAGLVLGGEALKREPALRIPLNWTVLALAALGLGAFAVGVLYLLPA
jgi:hypothetical protein